MIRIASYLDAKTLSVFIDSLWGLPEWDLAVRTVTVTHFRHTSPLFSNMSIPEVEDLYEHLCQSDSFNAIHSDTICLWFSESYETYRNIVLNETAFDLIQSGKVICPLCRDEKHIIIYPDEDNGLRKPIQTSCPICTQTSQ